MSFVADGLAHLTVQVLDGVGGVYADKAAREWMGKRSECWGYVILNMSPFPVDGMLSC